MINIILNIILPSIILAIVYVGLYWYFGGFKIIERTMYWIDVNDKLPEIPKGKYGVSVIVAKFDPVYAELNNGNGYSITSATYHFTKSGEIDFEELYIGGEEGSYYGPMGDRITHWMYFPKHP